MIAGYKAPESGSALTEDEAGAAMLKLGQAFRASQGQSEDGEQEESADATDESQEPEEQTESDTHQQDESDVDVEATDETTEEDTEEPEPTPRKRGRTLKVGDREQFVDEDEAYNGYLRQADYTRKTQAHAEIAKATAAERAAAASKREQYDAGLKQIEDALVVMMPQEPDWDRVRAERPTEYGALYTDWRRYQDRLSLVRAERDRVEQERQGEQSAQTAARRKDAAEHLVTLIPEWRDVSKRDADRVKLTSTARDYGFTDEEISAIEDPKQVVLLRDAMLYKELLAKQAKAKTQIGKAPTGNAKTARPGVPGNMIRQSKPAQAAKSRLAKSGNVEDAADAILHNLRAQSRRKK